MWNTEQGNKFLITHTKSKYTSKPKIFKSVSFFIFETWSGQCLWWIL